MSRVYSDPHSGNKSTLVRWRVGPARLTWRRMRTSPHLPGLGGFLGEWKKWRRNTRAHESPGSAANQHAGKAGHLCHDMLMVFSWVTCSPGCLWGQSRPSVSVTHSRSCVGLQVIEGLPLKGFLESRRVFGIFIISSDMPVAISRQMVVHPYVQSFCAWPSMQRAAKCLMWTEHTVTWDGGARWGWSRWGVWPGRADDLDSCRASCRTCGA